MRRDNKVVSLSRIGVECTVLFSRCELKSDAYLGELVVPSLQNIALHHVLLTPGIKRSDFTRSRCM